MDGDLMTYAELLPPLLFSYFMSALSFFAEAFLTLSIILIPFCFMGRDGKLKKATFIIPGILVAYGVIANIFISVQAIIYCRQHAAELVEATENANNDYMILIQMGVVFLATATAYSKHKLLHGIENIICYSMVQLYLQLLITCSMAFLSDDAVGTFRDAGIISNTLPKAHLIYFFSYFLVSLLLFACLYFGMYKRKIFFYVSHKYRILFVIWEVVLLYSVAKPLSHAGDNAGLFAPMKNVIGVMLPVLGIAFPFLIMIMVTRRNALEKTVIQESYISAELEYIDQYKRRLASPSPSTEWRTEGSP